MSKEHTFSRKFKPESKTLRVLLYTQVISLFVLLLFYLLARKSLPALVLALSLISFAVALSVSLYLYRRYRSIPIVQQKMSHRSQKRNLQREINKLQKQIKQAKQKREKIKKQKEKALVNREKLHEKRLHTYVKRRKNSLTNERKELSEALKKHQMQYFARKMKNTPINHSDIRGIGSGLTKRLAQYGIHSAEDINASRISQISGFGEAKTSSLTNWKKRVEKHIKNNLPQKLPDQKARPIQAKHKDFRNKLSKKAEQEHAAYEQDKATIREQAEKAHRENDQEEEQARKLLAELKPEEKAVDRELEKYSEITFLKFLSLSLRTGPPEWAKDGFPLAIIPVLIIMGFLCQWGTTLGSAATLIINSIPTPPSPPTLSPTASKTPTLTFTVTPSSTNTSTVTNTPTITPTFTQTHTPTVTSTPTITPTPSDTPTPTITPSP